VAQTAPNLQNQARLPARQGVTQQGFLGLGSGIIVSKKGYILTNSHLISGKKNFTVTVFTAKGSRTFPGKIVAEAVDRDLAIIKIEPGTLDLPVIPIGNSDRIRIGDQVLAFGNPFGLSQTVTGGIVSAMRQNVVIKRHQLTNLIQTDAPINQGNSGGPLVNLKGKVIGINTAIYSPGQTHTGLGFAVPINQATEVFAAYMDAFSPQANKAAMQYLEYNKPKGYPARMPGGKQGVGEDMPTWLGINIQILNDIIAEQMNVPVDRGILINEVYRNSPAAEAGMKRGDVIIRVDRKRITDETQIRKLLADKKPGDKVKLGILRGRKRINLKVRLAGGSFKQAGLTNKPGNLLEGSEIEAGTADIVSLGLTVDNITPELTFVYGLPEDTKGVLISGVEGISMPAGVKEGDIIKGVDGRKVKDLLSFFKRLKKANLKKGVKLELSRKGAPVEIVLKENPDQLSPGL
jgi:serine protease Do